MRGIRRAAAVLAVTLAGLALSVRPASAYAQNWELSAMGVPQAQALSQRQGQGVTVAILDTGVEDRHPALKGKVTQGPDLSGGRTRRGHPSWGRHGTAMAHDTLKVAPKAHILSIRTIPDKGDPDRKRWRKLMKEKLAKADSADDFRSPVANAIRYAADHGAGVISMSLGSDSQFMNDPDRDEEEAVAYAVAKGIPVLASAGNDGRIASHWKRSEANGASWPAGYPGVIAVAASVPGGRRAEFSTVHTYNDVASPGVGINSAGHQGGYQAFSGTSPACALAAGVVALMRSRNAAITPAQVRTALTRTANRPPGGWNATVGHGQINAAKAVAAAANPPRTLAKAVPYGGKETLGEPDGTPKQLAAGTHTEDLVTFGVGLSLGVVMLFTGLLLLRRKKTPEGLPPAAVGPAFRAPGRPGAPSHGSPGAGPDGPGWPRFPQGGGHGPPPGGGSGARPSGGYAPPPGGYEPQPPSQPGQQPRADGPYPSDGPAD